MWLGFTLADMRHYNCVMNIFRDLKVVLIEIVIKML